MYVRGQVCMFICTAVKRVELAVIPSTVRRLQQCGLLVLYLPGYT